MYKRIKIRLYPTEEQETLFYKHIGCCRKIWNLLLDELYINYEDTGKYIWGNDLTKIVTDYINDEDYFYFKEVSSQSLYLIAKRMNQALKNCFSKKYRNNTGFPKFKSKKKEKLSYPIRADRFYFQDAKTCNIEKVGKVKYQGKINFPYGLRKYKFYNVSLEKDHKGHWILSFAIGCESQTLEVTENSMGIDLGIKKLATVSFGNETFVYSNINKSSKVIKLEQRVKHLQRELDRRKTLVKGKKHSKNYYKTLKRLRYAYAKLTNIRENYIHQITNQLVKMKPSRICIEDLNVVGMMKNRHLSKQIQDAKFRMFRECITYKANRHNIPLVLANRFFPSSKTCSQCGSYKKDLKLKDRKFICTNCGTVIDRDINASINLMNYCE